MRPMMARTKEVFVRDLHDEAGEAWGGYSGDKGTATDGECEIMQG